MAQAPQLDRLNSRCTEAMQILPGRLELYVAQSVQPFSAKPPSNHQARHAVQLFAVSQARDKVAMAGVVPNGRIFATRATPQRNTDTPKK